MLAHPVITAATTAAITIHVHRRLLSTMPPPYVAFGERQNHPAPNVSFRLMNCGSFAYRWSSSASAKRVIGHVFAAGDC